MTGTVHASRGIAKPAALCLCLITRRNQAQQLANSLEEIALENRRLYSA
jgi:hypothetical protein